MDLPTFNVLIGHHDNVLFETWRQLLADSLLDFCNLNIQQVPTLTQVMEEVRNGEQDLFIFSLDKLLTKGKTSLREAQTEIFDCIATIKAKRPVPAIVCSLFDNVALKERATYAGADFFFVFPVALKSVKPALEYCFKLSGKSPIPSPTKNLPPLKGADLIHLTAAEGWLELGSHVEANEELEHIVAPLRSHPDVLELRWQIYAKARKWDACVVIASALITLAPDRVNGWIHRSFALHELKRTEEASDLLLPAIVHFPKDWLIRYNLACYACRLGNQEEAWNWLEEAFDLGDSKQVKLMALEDPDLETFWVEIREI